MTQWIDVGLVSDIPRLGSRVVKTAEGDVAVFRTKSDDIFAVFDACPHKGGPLSQGIVHGKSVTCPLHNWVVDLETGEALGPDEGCARHVPVSVSDGVISLELGRAKATGTDG